MTCKECQKPVEKNYGPELEEKQLCFTCNFWTHYACTQSHPDHFVIENKHYVVGREDAGRFMRGFGGARFKITPLDGRPQVITTNLWHQGTVPEHFRDRLPNNAVFVGWRDA